MPAGDIKRANSVKVQPQILPKTRPVTDCYCKQIKALKVIPALVE